MNARAGAPRLLVLAGHDPTGGAGVDADLEAARRFGADARAVVTAFTDQDGRRVLRVEPRPVADWMAEARAALDEAPAAIKTGLLPGRTHVLAAAEFLDAASALVAGVAFVVDPVLAASGGEAFLDDEGVEALLAELVPRGVVLTPNLPEAARLAECALDDLVGDPSARIAAARALLARGARAVLVKGGHGAEDPVRDLVLEQGGEPRWCTHARVAGELHGSGCRFASAVAAQLAAGVPLEAAAARAGSWLGELVRGAR